MRNWIQNRSKIIPMSIIFFALTTLPAWSAVYYVDIDNVGSLDDPAYGSSADTPWKTLHYAVGKLTTAGDVLNVAAGTYSTDSGEPDAALTVVVDGVTIQGEAGAVIDGVATCNNSSWLSAFVVDASNVVIKNLEMNNWGCDGTPAVDITRGSGNQIEGCYFQGNNPGITVSEAASSTQVVGNRFYNNASGVFLYGSNVEIGRNIFQDNDTAISMNIAAASSGINVYNNLIYYSLSGTYGIYMYTFSSTIAAQIYHNTIVGVANGIYMDSYDPGAAINADIRYNVIANTSGPGIFFDNFNGGSFSGSIDYNNVYNCVPNYTGSGVAKGANDISQDPGFVGVTDFHIQASSPCVDKIPSSSEDPINGDLDGNSRPAGSGFDMGCYELNLNLSAPDKPVNLSPVDEAVIPAGEAITLQANSFSDPDGHAHTASEWQVIREDNDEPVYNESTAALTSRVIPSADMVEVKEGLKYSWQVRYQDAEGQWSAWSDPFAFKVGTSEGESLPKVPPGATLADYGMISIVHWPDTPKPASVFKLKYDKRYYKFGTYDPVAGKYIEFNESLEVKPGRAYWMLAREGLQINYDGVPVALNVDIELCLHYNPATGNGWNMIAPPNEADYLWGDVQVGVSNEATAEIIEPKNITTLTDDTIIDRRIWEWKEGVYVSHLPADGFSMMRYKGYWIKANKEGAYLVFPQSAQQVAGLSKRPSIRVVWMKNRLQKLKKVLFGMNEAMADNDTPPMPMGALQDNDTENIFESCFVGTLKQ